MTPEQEIEVACKECAGVGTLDDAESGDISFNEWVCPVCEGRKTFTYVLKNTRTVQEPTARMIDSAECILLEMGIEMTSREIASIYKAMQEASDVDKS